MTTSSSAAVVQLLRRLEAQNVWRATGGGAATLSGGQGLFGQQLQSNCQQFLSNEFHTGTPDIVDGQYMPNFGGMMDGAGLYATQQQVNGQPHGLTRASSRSALHTQQQQHRPELMQPAYGSSYATVASPAHGMSAAHQTSPPPVQGEWYDDPSITVADALRILVERIRESGPVKQRHLQQLYQKCSTKEELEKALGLTRLNYLARGELQQHDPFSHRTSSILLQQAMKLEAPDIAKRALLQSTEFGFSPANTRLYNHLLIYHSKQKDLRSMLEMYELMKSAGPRPDSETCFILVKGSVDCDRVDIARAIVKEFDAAGARVRDGVRLYIEQHSA